MIKFSVVPSQFYEATRQPPRKERCPTCHPEVKNEPWKFKIKVCGACRFIAMLIERGRYQG